VTERLRRHRKEQTERRLLLGAAWHELDLVCDRGDGEHLDPDGFSHAFERFVARAGLPSMRLHDLRHAHATTLLAAGVHPKVVSEALGHASVAFTMDAYQHVLPTMGEQVAQAIEAKYWGDVHERSVVGHGCSRSIRASLWVSRSHRWLVGE
jgi:integrase